MPYKVSLAEWECRSTAKNTWAQKTPASSKRPTPCQVTGRYTQPQTTNQRRCIHPPGPRVAPTAPQHSSLGTRHGSEALGHDRVERLGGGRSRLGLGQVILLEPRQA